MPAYPLCPHCGQPFHEARLGVRVTPLKARIIDVIKTAGDIGVSSEELAYSSVWHDGPVSTLTVKAHVWQINQLIEETGWIIRSDARGRERPRWHLLRRSKRAA